VDHLSRDELQDFGDGTPAASAPGDLLNELDGEGRVTAVGEGEGLGVLVVYLLLRD
jgi:hypothetical protein